MIDRLRSVGAGTTLRGRDLRPRHQPDRSRLRPRTLTEANREEVLRIPLFVKAPGQVSGEVRDEPALNVDVLFRSSTCSTPHGQQRFDGHSLFDGSRPTRAPKVDDELAPAPDVAAGHARDVPGEGWRD